MKKQKGITLIALIITIVVLLILAVVTIGAVQESGIIRYATDAVIKQEIAIIQEKIKLKSAELILENKGETEITVEKILESYGITNSKNIRLSGDFKYISNDNEVPKVCYTLDLDKLSIDSKRGKGATEDGKSGDIFVIDSNKNVYYIIEAEIREFNPLETYIFGEKLEGKEVSFLNEDPTRIIYEDDLSTPDIDESKYVSLIDGHLTGINGNKANYTTYIDVGDGKYRYDYYVQYDENGTTVETNPNNGLTKLKLETTERLGKYVKYDNRNWIILYDDTTNGLQMVSADAYNNIELGYGDENYSEDEVVELDGVAGKSRIEISMHSYNNAVDTLNRICLESVTPRDGVILSVRSVGSNPINPEDNTNAYFAPEATSSWFESNLNLQKRTNDSEMYYVIKDTNPEEKYTIKDRDLNYIYDLDALLYLDIFKVENGNWNYFFASREAISYMDMGIIFGIRRSNTLDAGMDSNVWVMQDGADCENPSECIRPIITLNSDILNQLISASKTNSILGDGLSSTTPWDLDSYLKIN